jgi:tRNA A-37 threonylcarbamoyl transferase component Bud32
MSVGVHTPYACTYPTGIKSTVNRARTSRTFRQFLRGHAAAPPALIERLSADPDALLRQGHVIKQGPRSAIVRIEFDGHACVLKSYALKGPLHTAPHLFMTTRAAHCWHNALALAGTSLRTPQPLAMLERRLGPLRLSSYLVTEFVAGATLVDFVNRHANDADRLDTIARRFGEIWHALGARRIHHADMKATNFIVDEAMHIWLIDLDGMRRNIGAWRFAALHRDDRTRFLRNWEAQPDVAALFRRYLD